MPTNQLLVNAPPLAKIRKMQDPLFNALSCGLNIASVGLGKVSVTMVGTELTRTFDTVAEAFPSSAEGKGNDSCQQDGVDCGGGND